jgi:hypothetical protein
MKKLLGSAMLCLMLVSLTARGSVASIDNSDLWGNPNESGWGLQLVQRADVIFATLFVYDSGHAPVWYSATLQLSSHDPDLSAPGLWTGDLVQASGPSFGTVPFNPASVQRTTVGTMTFSALSDHDGTLTYSVNGVVVNKALTRTTLKNDNYSGDYSGILFYASEGCPDVKDRGLHWSRIEFEISQDVGSMTMLSQEEGGAPVCTSNGNYTQYGQFGSSRQVTSSCSDGSHAGNVTLFYEMNATFTGATMNFTMPSTNPDSKGCTRNGSIYGIRR